MRDRRDSGRPRRPEGSRPRPRSGGDSRRGDGATRAAGSAPRPDPRAAAARPGGGRPSTHTHPDEPGRLYIHMLEVLGDAWHDRVTDRELAAQVATELRGENGPLLSHFLQGELEVVKGFLAARISAEREERGRRTVYGGYDDEDWDEPSDYDDRTLAYGDEPDRARRRTRPAVDRDSWDIRALVRDIHEDVQHAMRGVPVGAEEMLNCIARALADSEGPLSLVYTDRELVDARDFLRVRSPTRGGRSYGAAAAPPPYGGPPGFPDGAPIPPSGESPREVMRGLAGREPKGERRTYWSVVCGLLGLVLGPLIGFGIDGSIHNMSLAFKVAIVLFSTVVFVVGGLLLGRAIDHLSKEPHTYGRV